MVDYGNDYDDFILNGDPKLISPFAQSYPSRPYPDPFEESQDSYLAKLPSSPCDQEFLQQDLMQSFVEESYVESTPDKTWINPAPLIDFSDEGDKNQDAPVNNVVVNDFLINLSSVGLDTSSLTGVSNMSSDSGKTPRNKFEIQSGRKVEMKISDEELNYIWNKKRPIVFRIMKTLGREQLYAFKNNQFLKGDAEHESNSKY